MALWGLRGGEEGEVGRVKKDPCTPDSPHYQAPATDGRNSLSPVTASIPDMIG